MCSPAPNERSWKQKLELASCSRADQRRELIPTIGYVCDNLYDRRLDPKSMVHDIVDLISVGPIYKDQPSAKEERIKKLVIVCKIVLRCFWNQV